MPFATWPRTRPSLPTNVQRSFPGVNRLDAFTIPDENATDIKNMTTANYPVLSTRPGFSVLGTAFAARVLGLGAWKQTELAAVANANWYRYTGGSWSSLKSGLSTTNNWSFANFHGNFSTISLIGANGVDPVQVYNGSTVSNLSNAPANANYVEQFAERVWLMVGNDLHGCALGNATNWATFNGDDADPYIKTVETPAGETVIGIKAGNSHLTIFFPNAMMELFGAVPSDFRTLPVTYDIGAVSNQAITSVEGNFYFVHQSGLFQYAGGTLPEKKWSEPVQDYIDRINPAAISKCCAGNNGKYVYIALPLDAATEPSHIIEYNTEFGSFSVFEGFAPLNMTEIANTVYIGGVEGQVRQLGASTSDNGTPIAYKWVTKPFGAGSLSQRLRWKRAWIVADVPIGSTLTVSMSKQASGDADWVLVQSITANTGIQSSRVIIPTSAAYNANWIRLKFEGVGPVNIYEWSREEEQLPIV